eukprot:2875806-Rhodomonas_salina.1
MCRTTGWSYLSKAKGACNDGRHTCTGRRVRRGVPGACGRINSNTSGFWYHLQYVLYIFHFIEFDFAKLDS